MFKFKNKRDKMKILYVFILLFVYKSYSLCHEDLSIENQITTRNIITDISCSDYSHFFTLDEDGFLEKRDKNRLSVLRHQSTGIVGSLICTQDYIVIREDGGNYLESYDKKYLNLVAKRRFSEYDIMIGYRNYIAATGTRRYNTIAYIDPKTLEIIEQDTFSISIGRLLYFREDLYALNREYKELYIVNRNKMTLYERLDTHHMDIEISDSGRVFWLDGYSSLNIQNKTNNVYSFDLSGLPFQYSYLQTNNFLKVDQHNTYISMKCSSHSVDHNYLIIGSVRSPDLSYNYQHCTFHDKTGGVRGILPSGDTVFVYHNLDDYSEIYSISTRFI